MRARALLVLAVLGLVACRHRREPEIHLIPAGYTGGVTIYFAADGEPLAREDGARVYRVGADGTYRVNARENLGVGPTDEQRFYYVHPDGRRVRLPLHRHDCVAPDELQVYAVASGGGSTRIQDGKTVGDPVTYKMYIVGVPGAAGCPGPAPPERRE